MHGRIHTPRERRRACSAGKRHDELFRIAIIGDLNARIHRNDPTFADARVRRLRAFALASSRTGDIQHRVSDFAPRKIPHGQRAFHRAAHGVLRRIFLLHVHPTHAVYHLAQHQVHDTRIGGKRRVSEIFNAQFRRRKAAVYAHKLHAKITLLCKKAIVFGAFDLANLPYVQSDRLRHLRMLVFGALHGSKQVDSAIEALRGIAAVGQ